MKLKLLLAAASLAGCAPVDMPSACRLVPVAEMKLRVVGNFPLVEAEIGGKPARLLLDTGAEAIVLNEAAFRRLGLARDYTRTVYSVGLGSQTGNWPSTPAVVTLGGVDLKPAALLSGHIAWPLRGANEVDGLLGSAALADYDVDIDMAQGRLALYEPRRCPGGPPPFAGPSTTLPATGYRRYALTVPVAVDGVAMPALLDTGATRSLVDPRTMGLDEAELQTDRAIRATTADPVGLQIRIHRFQRLQVGDDSIEAPLLAVGQVARPGFDALLGTDFLRTRRTWVSYAGRSVTFGPAQRRRVAVSPRPPSPDAPPPG